MNTRRVLSGCMASLMPYLIVFNLPLCKDGFIDIFVF